MARGFKTGGRKAGTPNRDNRQLKEMVREALDKAGGVEYLATMAKKNPSVFGTLLGRLIPQEVKNTGALMHFDLTKATDDELEQLERTLKKLAGIAADAG